SNWTRPRDLPPATDAQRCRLPVAQLPVAKSAEPGWHPGPAQRRPANVAPPHPVPRSTSARTAGRIPAALRWRTRIGELGWNVAFVAFVGFAPRFPCVIRGTSHTRCARLEDHPSRARIGKVKNPTKPT